LHQYRKKAATAAFFNFQTVQIPATPAPNFSVGDHFRIPALLTIVANDEQQIILFNRITTLMVYHYHFVKTHHH